MKLLPLDLQLPPKGAMTMTSKVTDSVNNASASEDVWSGALTKKDLTRMAVNPGALGMEYSWNYPKQMSIPFCMMLNPLLKKIYKDDPDGYAAALTRHLEFFNITMYFAPFVGGVVASMEERVAKGEIEPEAVSSVKTALMGPLSGIGDSLFLGTLRVIAAAVGIGLSLAGNPLGPIVFLLIYNIPAFLTRIIGAHKGYELGVSFLTKAQESGLMDKVVYAAGIVGVMVIGAMTVTMTSVTIPIEFGQGESIQTIQSVLDGIMPGSLALVALGLYYWGLSKRMSPMLLIVITMVIGIVGAFTGVLA